MIISLLLFLVFDCTFAQDLDCQTVYINEFHYDNFFRDTQIHDFVEFAAPAGYDLEGWTIMTYDHKSQRNFHFKIWRPLCFSLGNHSSSSVEEWKN